MSLALPSIIFVTMASVVLSACGSSATQSSSTAHHYTDRELVLQTAYRNVEATVKNNGQMLCDSITAKSRRNLARLRKQIETEGAPAGSCRQQADAFIATINSTDKQKSVNSLMLREITNSARIKINNNKAILTLPSIAYKGGRAVVNPDGTHNTLTLEYERGQWRASQCKWILS
jgi:hypothetical protein